MKKIIQCAKQTNKALKGELKVYVKIFYTNFLSVVQTFCH